MYVTELSKSTANENRGKKCGSCTPAGLWRRLKNPNTLLLTLTLAGVVLGISIGILIKWKTAYHPMTPRQVSYLNFPGEILMRMLKMVIMPLMFFTLINSLATLDTKTANRLLFVAFCYYIITMIVATTLGAVLSVVIRPGSYSPVVLQNDNNAADKAAGDCKGASAFDSILDIFRNIFMDNLIDAALSTIQTCPIYKLNETTLPYAAVKNLTGDSRIRVVEDMKTVRLSSLNMLGMVAFSLSLGGVLAWLGSEAKPVVDFSLCMEKVIMVMVKVVIWFSPVGIACLIAAEILNFQDAGAEIKRLGMYSLTVMLGLSIHCCVVLPCLLLFAAKRNPIKFVKGLSQALFVAFGTGSSNATMPVTLECMENNMDIDHRVSKFVVPFGTTVNKNGTALYESVAAIYVSQCMGITFNVGELIMVCLSSLFAATGTAGVPQGGLVTMVLVLTAIGLPTKYAVLVVPVDWILGRFRTIVNVFDDAVGCAFVQRFCENHLKRTSNTNKVRDGEHFVEDRL